MATVRITPEATTEFNSLPKAIRDRVLKMLIRLEDWPAMSGVKSLSGNLAGWYRARVGAYRVRFYVIGDVVHVDKIGHRKDIMKTKAQSSGATAKRRVAAKRVTVKGKRMVMLEETEFDRLMREADLFEPLLPNPLPDGNYPAVEYACASIAIDIVRHRRRLGLSQVELARLAGVRPETLNRIEQGHRRSPSVRTIEKIDRALREAEGANNGP